MSETKLKTSFGEANIEYARFRPTYPECLLSAILENIKKPHKNVLDIGAGTGIFTRMLSEVFESVTAVEPDEKMIECGSFGRNVNLVNKRTEDTALEKNVFDLVTAANSFYWMEAEVVLDQIHNWLRKDGVLAAFRYNLPLTDNSNKRNNHI